MNIWAKSARSPVTFTTFAANVANVHHVHRVRGEPFAANSARSLTRSLVHRVNLARRTFSEKSGVRGERRERCELRERVRRERAEFAANSERTPSSLQRSLWFAAFAAFASVRLEVRAVRLEILRVIDRKC